VTEQPEDHASADLPDVESPDVASAHPDVADPRVAEALEQLTRLADTAPAEHAEVYEQVHRVLQDALAAAQADDTSGTGSPADTASPASPGDPASSAGDGEPDGGGAGGSRP